MAVVSVAAKHGKEQGIIGEKPVNEPSGCADRGAPTWPAS
jgi:hypothetical protein